LEKAYKELPEIVKEHHRFEIPKILSIIQGKNTVVKNLGDVSKAINRDAGMLSKFLLKEFGTSGSHDGQHLIMKGQFKQDQVQERFETFLKEYVFCFECGRPDTKIVREDRISFLKCEACGARQSLIAIVAAPKKEKELRVGDEITVEITGTGKKGDGTAKIGEYTVFVSNARVGQKVKAKITKIRGTLVFASAK
jgi:translation initiation factor 2 subunit 2